MIGYPLFKRSLEGCLVLALLVQYILSFPLFPEIQELRVKGWVKVRSISLEEEGPQGTPPE
jgi:hypothetical protein